MTDTTDRNPPEPELESPPVSTGAEPPAEPDGGHVDLGRISWLVIVVGCAVTVLILLLKREWGYASVTGAVALSALINLV